MSSTFSIFERLGMNLSQELQYLLGRPLDVLRIKLLISPGT